MTNEELVEKYIEHEVEIRLTKELSSEKFLMMRADFHKLENKLNSLIALVISGIIIPVILHWTKVI